MKTTRWVQGSLRFPTTERAHTFGKTRAPTVDRDTKSVRLRQTTEAASTRLGRPLPKTESAISCGNDQELASVESAVEGVTLWDRLCGVGDVLSVNYAWVILVAAALALHFPGPFLSFSPNAITLALSVSMLAMGCTLKLEDFTILSKCPFHILIGLALQYTVMPGAGFAISRLAGLSAPVAAGIILVSCCPGGVASNIVTYLAGGDVALSVCLTSISTFLAIVLTPVLTALLIGTLVPVNRLEFFLSTVQVILLPVVVGLLAKSLFPRTVEKFQRIAPLIAVVAVLFINCTATAKNAQVILSSGLRIFLCVAVLHLTGFGLGFLAAVLLQLPLHHCITISIEVGMQNSGLGAVLATKHFASPLSTCVCVVSALFHSILGGSFATFVRRYLHRRNAN